VKESVGNRRKQAMQREKFTHKKDESETRKTIFCAECGDELEMFGVSDVDLQKIKERHKRCRDIGKFKGDKCAMMFIADAGEFPFTEETD
jgi:hypothetical protein